jgi:hypothetical protein
MTLRLQVFSKGKQVWWKGRPFLVDYITVSGFDLWVRLEGLDHNIKSTDLEIEYTTLKER